MTWTEAVAAVDLSRFPFDVRLKLRDSDALHPVLIVSIWVPERDGGTRENPFFGAEFLSTLPSLPSYKSIRDAILIALEHELDEMFLVRGERVFDPHRGDRRK